MVRFGGDGGGGAGSYVDSRLTVVSGMHELRPL